MGDEIQLIVGEQPSRLSDKILEFLKRLFSKKTENTKLNKEAITGAIFN